MSQRILTLKVDLSHPLVVHPIPGILGGGDCYADIIRVLVYQDGEPVQVTGTVTGYVMNQAGDTFTVSGAADGNGAQIQLPETAYELTGPITVAIRETRGTVRTTLAICSTAVKATTTGTEYDPGDMVPNIDNLREAWERAEAAAVAAEQKVQDFNDIILVQSAQPSSETNRIWVQPQADEYRVPSWEEFIGVAAGQIDFPSAPVQKYWDLAGTTKNPVSIGDVISGQKAGESWHYCFSVAGLVEGETFTITASDGASARPWGILDKDNVLRARASGATVTNATVTVPAGCGGGTLLIQVRNTNIGTASVVRNMNVMSLGAAISQEKADRIEADEEISERMNLFDDTLTYRQTQADGTNDGTRSPSDGAYTTNKNYTSHGQRWWCLTGETLPAGTYTLSAFVTLATATNRAIRMGIGRGSGTTQVRLTTERGGVEYVDSTATSGWVKLTKTLAEEMPWGVAFVPLTSDDQTSTISQIQLEKGATLTAYTEDEKTAVDKVARAAFDALTSTTDVSTAQTSIATHLNTARPLDCFLYFTDPHMLESNALARFDSWFDWMKSAYQQLPADFAVCGGDWIGNSDAPEAAIVKLGRAKAKCRECFDRVYLVLGNHDTNYQGDSRLSQQVINNTWYGGEKSYYTFETANALYIVLDTGVEASNFKNASNYAYYKAEADWLAETLRANSKTHIVLLPHMTYSNYSAATESEVAAGFLSIANAYNTTSSASITTDTGTVTYTFSTAPAGRVDFCLCGHSHRDATATLHGIPCVIRTSMRYSGSNDTLQPVFDVVVVDFEPNADSQDTSDPGETAHFIRVGDRGQSLDFSFKRS